MKNVTRSSGLLILTGILTMLFLAGTTNGSQNQEGEPGETIFTAGHYVVAQTLPEQDETTTPENRTDNRNEDRLHDPVELTADPIEPGYCLYTIQPGDALSNIAGRLTGDQDNYPQIIEFNDLASGTIRVGDQLKIPKSLLLPEFQSCGAEPSDSAEDRDDSDLKLNGVSDEEVEPPGPDAPADTQTDIEPTVPGKAYTPYAEIGDLVWYDINADGVQNDGAATGVPNVRVYLLDENGNRFQDADGNDIFAISDPTGFYIFDELLPGDYSIEFDLTTLPAEYRVSPQDQGDDDALDSDGDRATGRTILTTLDADKSDVTWDLGIFHPVSIGNYVWIDSNVDGMQDEVGTGIENVRVELYVTADGGTTWNQAVDVDGNPNWSTTTDSNGLYAFTNLPPGDYRVEIPDTNWNAGGVFHSGEYAGALGSPGSGADDTNDTDDNGNNDGIAAVGGVQSSLIALSSEQEINDGDTDSNNNPTVDFGFYLPVSLGNRVWYDTDCDGIQDAGEPGIPGVTVELLDAATLNQVTVDAGGGAMSPTQTTDANGYYRFTNLPSGDYVVRVPQSNWTTGAFSPGQPYAGALGSPGQGGDSGISPAPATYLDDNGDNDGDLAYAGVQSTAIVLRSHTEPELEDSQESTADSNSDLSVDFGFYTYDYGDLPTGIAGYPDYPVTNAASGAHHVIERDAAGAPRTFLGASVDAESDGRPGITAGLAQPPLPAEGDDGTDSDDEDGIAFLTPILPGELYQISVTTGSAGVLNAWIDWNGDGDFDDAGERVLPERSYPGATAGDVVLLTALASPLASGHFPATLYSRFRFTPGTGQATTPTTPAGTTPPPGEVEDYALLSLGDLVWRDNGAGGGMANDGIRQPGEAGIPDVTVELINQATGAVTTTETNIDGRYLFTGLTPGDYQVRIPYTEFQSDGDLFKLMSSDDILLTGTDPNNDVNETGDENGLDNLEPENPVTGSISSLNVTLAYATEPAAPANDDGDSDANSNRSVDLGFYEPVAIGNYMWVDNGAGNGVPNDGILNGNEPPVPDGVEVWLYRDTDGDDIVEPGGDDIGPFRMTLTSNGQYWFDRLPPDQYVVYIPELEFQEGGLLNGYVSTTGAGADEITDQHDPDDPGIGDENSVDPVAPDTLETIGMSSTQFDLFPGIMPAGETSQPDYPGTLPDEWVNATADFAFYRPVAIGNYVWIDDGVGAGGVPNDGQINGTETGVPDGVEVQLFRDADNDGVAEPGGDDGTFYATTTTTNGQYMFDMLPPDQYFIHISASQFEDGLLAHYVSSTGAGTDDSADEGADENGVDAPFADLPADGLSTMVYDLQPDSEPAAEPSQGNYSGVLPDASVNMTADLAFYQPVAIGNQLWFDNGDGTPGSGTANNGILDVSETGVGAGVELYLYRDGVDTIGETPFRTTTTDVDGRYLFDDLPPDQYIVSIPASQFASGSPLEGYLSSSGAGTSETANDYTADENVDENGIDPLPSQAIASMGVRSMVYDLRPGTEPAGELNNDTYPGLWPDSSVNFTADFGFVNRVALGNLLWVDNGVGDGIPNNGIPDGSEPAAPDGVQVELYGSGDTIGTPFRSVITTGGQYLFDDLPPGQYFVHIPSTQFEPGGLLEGYHASGVAGTTQTGDQNADQNGIDVDNPAAGGISSMVYTLTAGQEPAAEFSQSSYTAIFNGTLADESVNMTADFGLLQYDFGDWPQNIAAAPDYPTLLVTGSRHVIDGKTYLGGRIDAEIDGQPGVGANDDDLNPAADDEDGVRFLTPIMPGRAFTIEVTPSVSGGYLYAWIDFDGDGVLEQITFNESNSLSGGAAIQLTVTAPDSSVPFSEVLYSRFRFTSAPWSTPDPTGDAVNASGVSLPGEVEDYVLLSFGNLVWRDDGTGGGTVNDGIRQPGEPGIPKVWLGLHDHNGNPIRDANGNEIRTQTDSNGNYRFTGLTPGDYPGLPRDYVVYVLPENFDTGTIGQNNNEPLFGYVSTTGNGGSNDDSDDDQDENGVDNLTPATYGIASPPFTLTAGGEPAGNGLYNPTVDFGFLQYDRGDVPDSYGTLQASNGARHVIDRATYLGDGVDAEGNGQPNPEAEGDDAADTDSPVAMTGDEDGVRFLTPVMPGQPYQIEVNPSVAGGVLNAWIDFNGDGDFLDAGEQIQDEVTLGTAGWQLLTLSNSPNAPDAPDPFPTTLYARFRFTQAAGQANTPDGEASNGEVEDYALGSIGSLLWLDNGGETGAGNNDGRFDPATENGIAGATVELYLSTQTPGVDSPIATTTTDGNGNYRFTGLTERTFALTGDAYIVFIPPDQFIRQNPADPAPPLENLYSSSDPGGMANNPNTDPDDHDADENGIDDDYPYQNGISSLPIELEFGTEPIREVGEPVLDANSNLTIDFGFIREPILP